MTDPELYPPADAKTQWFENQWGGARMDTRTVLLHTTETSGWPGYASGSMAPNLTARPNFTTKRLDWRQHFRANTSSRALANAAGGVQTNTEDVCQVELVGSCYPGGARNLPGRAVDWSNPPDWCIRDLAAFASWAHKVLTVPYVAASLWLPYPLSYGNSNARMSPAAWVRFSGFAGHEHAPENDHGDPGALPIDAVLAAARLLDGPSVKPPPNPHPGADVTLDEFTTALQDTNSALSVAMRNNIRIAVDNELDDEADGQNNPGRVNVTPPK